MSQAKIDRGGVVTLVLTLLGAGALYYFSYITVWGGMLLDAVGLLMLFWSVLSPLYVLFRLALAALERRRAAKLGMTVAAYQAMRHPERYRPAAPTPSRADRVHAVAVGLRQRMLRIAPWELAVFSAGSLLFGVLTEGWRHRAGDVNVSALGMVYALMLYTMLGLQVLHRAWAHWHHRLVPGSAAFAEPPAGALPRSQKLWNGVFGLCLVFAIVELLLSGATQTGVVVVTLAAPALVAGLLAGLWRAVRPLIHHHRSRALQG